MKLNKALLRKLINEVIREAEEMSAEDPEANTSIPQGDDSTMKHSRDLEKKHGDTMIKLSLKGLKPGKAYKKIMGQMAYIAKQNDLDVIHAEIEKAGKPIDSMDIGTLKNIETDDDKFDTTAAKSVTRKTSKEKPPLQGSPEDWERLGQQDIEKSREKVKLKQAKIAAGTYDPSDTSLWTDKEWDAWEAEQRQKDPKGWAAFDAFMKAKQKT